MSERNIKCIAIETKTMMQKTMKEVDLSAVCIDIVLITLGVFSYLLTFFFND